MAASSASSSSSSSSSSAQIRNRNPFLLGFYSQKQLGYCFENGGSIRRQVLKPEAPVLVTICEKGRDLKKGKWGSFDETLSFLPQREPVQIVGSSNGWLLCCTDGLRNVNFIVCNPVTREFQIIPELHNPFHYVAIAFVCRGGYDDHGDGNGNGTLAAGMMPLQCEIFRVGVVSYSTPATTFEMEYFSSTTGEWTESSLVTPVPIFLEVALGPRSYVLEGVIYWKAYICESPEQPLSPLPEVLIAYDPARESVVGMIRFPECAPGYHVTWSDSISVSQGKIHYARHDRADIEVWILEDIQRGEWILLHKASVQEMSQENPHVPIDNDRLGITHFHSQRQKILLKISRRWYWYNYQSGKLSGGASGGCSGVSFPYEWHCEPTYD